MAFFQRWNPGTWIWVCLVLSDWKIWGASSCLHESEFCRRDSNRCKYFTSRRCELKGGSYLRVLIASLPQNSGLAGAEINPDVNIEMDMGKDKEQTLSLDVGLGAQPTQPPHPQLGLSTSMADISVSDISVSGNISVSDVSAAIPGADPAAARIRVSSSV